MSPVAFSEFACGLSFGKETRPRLLSSWLNKHRSCWKSAQRILRTNGGLMGARQPGPHPVLCGSGHALRVVRGTHCAGLCRVADLPGAGGRTMQAHGRTGPGTAWESVRSCAAQERWPCAKCRHRDDCVMGAFPALWYSRYVGHITFITRQGRLWVSLTVAQKPF